MRTRTLRARHLALVTTLLISGSTLAMGAGAATADTGCEPRNLTQSFQQWGDDSWYFTIPGGDFETDERYQWSRSEGAGFVPGNERWRVLGKDDSQSLRLINGASATSPTFCVARDEDSLRLFVRRPNIANTYLNIHIDVTNGEKTASVDYYVDGADFGWMVTDRMALPDIRDDNGMQWVTVSFIPNSAEGRWRVDDVQLDPWKTR